MGRLMQMFLPSGLRGILPHQQAPENALLMSVKHLPLDQQLANHALLLGILQGGDPLLDACQPRVIRARREDLIQQGLALRANGRPVPGQVAQKWSFERDPGRPLFGRQVQAPRQRRRLL